MDRMRIDGEGGSGHHHHHAAIELLAGGAEAAGARRPFERRVDEVMSWSPLTVTPEVPVAEALRITLEGGVHHLPVVDGADLVGIVCVHDLHETGPGACVADCMSAPVACVEPDVSLRVAAAMMHARCIHALAVVNGGELIGILTEADLRRANAYFERRHGDGACAACGSRHHVRRHPRMENVDFCLDCLERARPPGILDDLGGGD